MPTLLSYYLVLSKFITFLPILKSIRIAIRLCHKKKPHTYSVITHTYIAHVYAYIGIKNSAVTAIRGSSFEN